MADQQIVAQMQARINELSAQTAELVQGLARANAAYESQRDRLTSAEQELVDTKAKLQEQASSSSGSRETQLIHPSNVPKPPQYNDKKEGMGEIQAHLHGLDVGSTQGLSQTVGQSRT